MDPHASLNPSTSWRLVLPEEIADQLFEHLFPGDGDEHGAVIAAGWTASQRGVRLLARELFLARDGIDYVQGDRSHRKLTAAFVADKILRCSDEGLVYLAVHNHLGGRSVSFSGTDLASHERGYPALLEINAPNPVGAVVFTREAAAGDVWLQGGERVELECARVIGTRIRTMRPSPRRGDARADAMYDRQARLFGDAGQEVLGGMKVGVIGAGGAGSLIIEFLARLGVGHLVVVDPDRVELSNVPRLIGSTLRDAAAWFTKASRPAWLRGIGTRLARTKVALARRSALRANPGMRFEGLFGDVTEGPVAERFKDCDYLFLAADTHSARHVFNALAHQYLIPGVQVGAKVPVDPGSGDVGEVFAVSRPVRPGQGCLWCNELISPTRLQDEAEDPAQLRRQRYVDDPDVVAPSVVTLNAVATSHAVNDFLFSVTGLAYDDADSGYLMVKPRQRRTVMQDPRRDVNCRECSSNGKGRLGLGDARDLPVRRT